MCAFQGCFLTTEMAQSNRWCVKVSYELWRNACVAHRQKRCLQACHHLVLCVHQSQSGAGGPQTTTPSYCLGVEGLSSLLVWGHFEARIEAQSGHLLQKSSIATPISLLGMVVQHQYWTVAIYGKGWSENKSVDVDSEQRKCGLIWRLKNLKNDQCDGHLHLLHVQFPCIYLIQFKKEVTLLLDEQFQSFCKLTQWHN